MMAYGSWYKRGSLKEWTNRNQDDDVKNFLSHSRWKEKKKFDESDTMMYERSVNLESSYYIY